MFYDAHQHLHDRRLDAFREAILEELPRLSIAGGIVNGTAESDWPAVERLCEAHSWLRPAFGLHPWYARARSAVWESSLTDLLDRHPEASIGETGLDCWIEEHDIEDQKKVFMRQLNIARERNLTITIHCVKAHEPLRQVLQKNAAPERGFLLHAWGGPAELTPFLLERGAHFSFPPYFLHERKSPQRALFQSLPVDRILVETDAPDLLPPPERNSHLLTIPGTGNPVNHPANLLIAYEALAGLREVSLTTLASAVEKNWRRLFDRAPAETSI